MNFLLLLAFGLITFFLQVTVVANLFGIIKPDLTVIYTVQLGLSQNLLKGSLLAFLLGCLISISSGDLFMIFPLMKLLEYIGIKLIKDFFIIERPFYKSLLVFLTCLGENIFLTLLSLPRIRHSYEFLPSTLLPSFLTVILSILFFTILQRIATERKQYGVLS